MYYDDARPADWDAAKLIATELGDDTGKYADTSDHEVITQGMGDDLATIATEIGDTDSDASDLEVHTSDITTLSADNCKAGTVKLAGIFINQGIELRSDTG